MHSKWLLDQLMAYFLSNLVLASECRIQQTHKNVGLFDHSDFFTFALSEEISVSSHLLKHLRATILLNISNLELNNYSSGFVPKQCRREAMQDSSFQSQRAHALDNYKLPLHNSLLHSMAINIFPVCKPLFEQAKPLPKHVSGYCAQSWVHLIWTELEWSPWASCQHLRNDIWSQDEQSPVWTSNGDYDKVLETYHTLCVQKCLYKIRSNKRSPPVPQSNHISLSKVK